MSHLHTASSVFALCLLALSPPLHAQESAMTPQEIQTAWVGKTVSAQIGAGPNKGKLVTLELKANGSAELSGAVIDSGTWRLWDKGYCATWTKIRSGQERCLSVTRSGAELQVLNPDGSLNATVVGVK